MSMSSLKPFLDSLLSSLPPRPIEQSKLDDLVKDTLEQSNGKVSAENRKSLWEYLLKSDIFVLAATEGEALKDEETTYYDELRDKLDLILTFTEHDACEQTFPFIVLQDLLETQTIRSCSHIFSWIEARSARLTIGMVPQKGKALILLRTLNDLLRRLSKMGSTTIFCGRILTFLSGVFPLGERSGVNLRGEYGPTWEGLTDIKKKVDVAKAETTEEAKPAKEIDAGDAMQVDEKENKRTPPKPSDKKEDFYNTFWSLQLPFSKPPLFANPETFPQFKESVNKVLPVIKEATAKERLMMGSRSNAGAASLKRKREPDAEEVAVNEYFFAKFLTSPDLVDLEVADTHFRRQFLFQLLILLHHLLTFTKAAKAVWASLRNRSLQMEFTLEPADAQWVQDTITKAMDELRQTTPNGRAFADIVAVILEREKNWVKWKNELCAPFDKEPAYVEVDGEKVGLFEATRSTRQKMMVPPADWEWALGTAPLTEIWEMGCRGLEDLQNPFQPGDVKDFVKKIKQDDARIEMRKKTLAKAAERVAQAKAAAAAKAVLPPAAPEKETNVPTIKTQEVPTPSPSEPPSSTPPAPRAVTSILHPSLPAKPGTSPIKPSPSSQESATSAAAPIASASATPLSPIPPPAATPAPASTPVQLPAPAPAEPTLPITDEQILKLEESKQRWAWLALRTARDQYLQHFGKIGTGDIELLAKEIEKEKQERERIQKGEEISGSANMAGVVEESAIDSPVISTVTPPLVSDEAQVIKTDGEDIKMEEG
ncbi:THO complex subunit 1 [Hypsizygus marmoreus]|uniref:THO complex subunit 1 n=1 Tax=Hypsizygus marmoreus TaxID=39966 RepID=A0A369JGG8_HYPMA|nr:THO complex subunit 1 [Hypsizygus marmoreus]